MKLESIYKDLLEIIESDMNAAKIMQLKEKLEKAIREETCYKTTSKTRVNAIKKVASKDGVRPILQGYSIQGDYKVITDSYHAIYVKEDNMPLKLVTTDNDLMQKFGKDNCITGVYPDLLKFIDFNMNDYTTKELSKSDLDDILSFYKMYHSDTYNKYYTIDNKVFNVNFLKNIIDVLKLKDSELLMYIPKEDYRPLFIKNNNDEWGLILPIKKY